MRGVVCSLAFVLFVGLSSAYAQSGCFALDQKPGKCYGGTLRCSFNSFLDHTNYGSTVGDLCDQIAIANNSAQVLQASLQQCGENFNQALGTNATDAINVANCLNQQKIVENKLVLSEAAVAEIIVANKKLRRQLRIAQIKARSCR